MCVGLYFWHTNNISSKRCFDVVFWRKFIVISNENDFIFKSAFCKLTVFNIFKTQMFKHAQNLEFEQAAQCRDEMVKLKEQVLLR